MLPYEPWRRPWVPLPGHCFPCMCPKHHDHEKQDVPLISEDACDHKHALNILHQGSFLLLKNLSPPSRPTSDINSFDNMFLDPSSITYHIPAASDKGAFSSTVPQLPPKENHSCPQPKYGWSGVSSSENWVYTPLPPCYTTSGDIFNTIVSGNGTLSSKAQSTWWCVLVSCFPGSVSYVPTICCARAHRYRQQDYSLKQRESRTLDNQGREQDGRAVS